MKRAISGIRTSAFLIVENTKFMKMANVSAKKITFPIKVSVLLVPLTHGFQKTENHASVRKIIIGTLTKIHVIT